MNVTYEELVVVAARKVFEVNIFLGKKPEEEPTGGLFYEVDVRETWIFITAYDFNGEYSPCEHGEIMDYFQDNIESHEVTGGVVDWEGEWSYEDYIEYHREREQAQELTLAVDVQGDHWRG